MTKKACLFWRSWEWILATRLLIQKLSLKPISNSLPKAPGIVTLKNTCTNQDGEIIVEGETVVRLYEAPA